MVVLQRTIKKGTKIYNARAQPLSLYLLLGDVVADSNAFAVVLCLSSLSAFE